MVNTPQEHLPDDIINLSVGGLEYQTAYCNLVKDRESMLAAMFSGRHSFQVDLKGRYFIDRDGQLFRYVLNYLRNNELSIPRENSVLISELIREAEYYQLDGMLQELQIMH